MRNAIRVIKEGNSDVDQSARFAYDEPHFTGEKFSGGKAYMQQNHDQMVSKLNTSGGDIEGARRALGTIFHAIQDFYSHSNWIEMGRRDAHPSLRVSGPSFSDTAGPAEATCVNCITGNECDLPPVLPPFGAWSVTCYNNISTGKLTTAYFRVAPYSPFKPAGKCNHGGTLDYGVCHIATGGIAKDGSGSTSPHSYLHFTAAPVAKEATKAYIRDLRNTLDIEKFKLLFGVGHSIGIALDSTASMNRNINLNGIKGGIIGLLRARIESVTDLGVNPSYMVLSIFNDNSLGPLTVTDNLDIFQQALYSYTSTGDQDCPEAAWRGVRRAVEKMDGGDLFVYTDASSNDSYLQDETVKMAQKKRIKIHWVINGSCSPIAAGYIRSAGLTGGQVIYYEHADAEKTVSFVDFTFRPNDVQALAVQDYLPQGGAKTYSFPVDSTLSNLLVSVSGQEAYNGSAFPPPNAVPTVGGVSLTRPDGSTVQSTDSGVRVIDLANGRFLKIDTPIIGIWTVTVSANSNSSGRFSLQVTGDSDLSLDDLQFTERKGWPGHEGASPINQQPAWARKYTIVAEASSGLINTAQFELRRKDGSVIRGLGLNQLQTPPGGISKVFAGEYNPYNAFGSITLQEFYIYMTGQSTNGQVYQRVWPVLISPREFEISSPDPQELVPNQTTTYDFRIRTSLGSSGGATVQARSSQGYILSVTALAEEGQPAQDLLQNQILYLDYKWRTVRVQLRPPANATLGSIDLLTLSVFFNGFLSDIADSAGNSAYVESVVVNSPDTVIPYAGCSQNLTVTSNNGQPRVVNYLAPDVSDNRSGTTTNCTPASGYAFPVGVTTVGCIVTDAAGNQGGCQFTVTVTTDSDQTAPTFTNCPPDIVAAAPYGQSSVAVAYPLPQATDNRDGSVPVSCSPAPGTQFSRGTTVVTCTASDSAGNQASCSFPVKVFDVSIQDDLSGDTLLFNSITGDYIFYRCGASGFTLSGRGTITRQGCLVKLGGDPKVSATLDSCIINPANRGSATIKPNPIGGWIYLTDSNTTNNLRPCPNG